MYTLYDGNGDVLGQFEKTSNVFFHLGNGKVGGIVQLHDPYTMELLKVWEKTEVGLLVREVGLCEK